jgi:hypothetical protein
MVSNTSFRQTAYIMASSSLAVREFHEVQQELERVTSQLRTTLETHSRRSLLRELRTLLEEADFVVESGM